MTAASLSVGVILDEGQERQELEQELLALAGEEKDGKISFRYVQRSADGLAQTLQEWKKSGVRLILDGPSTEEDSEDIRVALVRLLSELSAELDEKTFLQASELLQRLAGSEDLRPLDNSDRLLLAAILASLPPVKRADPSARLRSGSDTQLFRVLSDAADGSSGHELRFAFADPSYAINLSAVKPSRAGEKPKRLITDLELFIRDAEGLPYALRMERLEKKARGAFTHALLVRDPALKNEAEVLARYPETVSFQGRMLFAPDITSTSQLAKLENTLILMPAPGLLVRDDHESLVLSLDADADSSIGILETGALLLQNPEAQGLRGLRKLSETVPGVYVYLPQIAPIDYQELLRALAGARMAEQSA